MSKIDLVLLHAPAIYDFRKRPIVYGPISDAVPSTPIFDMYPIGFMTLAARLRKEGLSVRIVNVAVKMLRNKNFNVELFLRKLNPLAFGLDLHWLVHVQGSLELARIIKKNHPDTPVIFGGLSASYYYPELITFPEVDYVIRGDSGELPLVELIKALKTHRSLHEIPNLVWKNRTGTICVNELSHIPEDLDDLIFDYQVVMKSVFKYRDFSGHLPFKKWRSYPITAVLPMKGCIYNCVACGGSKNSYQRICGRSKPAFRGPEILAEDINNIARFSSAPIILLGDIRQGQIGYVDKFLNFLKKKKIDNHLAFEVFSPWAKDFLNNLSQTVTNFNFQISPESHDDEIRLAFGRPYNNTKLEKFIQDALEAGCKRLDLFFMIGLPKQTAKSVNETTEYCDYLLKTYGGDKKLHVFMAPLAPFVDPGSEIFEKPERHGYKIFYKTLAEHQKAMYSPSWKYMLNYETKWMSRDEIVMSTYEACLKLNTIKKKYGFVEPKIAQQIEARIYKDMQSIKEAEKMGVEENIVAQPQHILSRGGNYEQEEMDWPKKMGLKFLRIIWELIKIAK